MTYQDYKSMDNPVTEEMLKRKIAELNQLDEMIKKADNSMQAKLYMKWSILLDKVEKIMTDVNDFLLWDLINFR